MKKRHFWADLTDYLLCMVGGVIYSAAMNLFIFPRGLYIGNLTGISQIIQELLQVVIPTLGDVRGFILLALNLPLLIIAFKVVNRKFFLKTVLAILTVALAMQFIPVVNILPALDDLLTICIIGGILAGFGIGLALKSGGSSGGVDTLGVLVSLKNSNYSVGRVSLLISLAVYLYAFVKFPPEIVVYSVIFSLICNFVIDQVHYQNVKVSVTIITKEKELLPYITQELVRGATWWNGKGAFTDSDVMVINTVVSKYELVRMRKELIELDPQAFLIENHEVNVTGYFPAHFF